MIIFAFKSFHHNTYLEFPSNKQLRYKFDILKIYFPNSILILCSIYFLLSTHLKYLAFEFAYGKVNNHQRLIN